MKLTAGAANLLVEAADRSDRARRRAALADARAAIEPDGKRYNETMKLLGR